MSGYRLGVRVMPRNEVLDTQGRAVADTLRHQGKEVSECRVGKYVILNLNAKDSGAAMTQAKEIAETVLHNPLIETFEIEELR